MNNDTRTPSGKGVSAAIVHQWLNCFSRTRLFLALLLFCLGSCNDEEKGPVPVYVASSSADNGYVFSFLPGDANLKPGLELGYSSAGYAQDGNMLYIHISPYYPISNIIQKVDLDAGVIADSKIYSFIPGRRDRRTMRYFNDRLFIADFDEDVWAPIIRIVDTNTLEETDTIHISTNQPIHDLFIREGKMFVDLSEKITVLDMATWESIKTIDLPHTTAEPPSSFNLSEFVPGRNSDLYICNGGIRRLNTGDMTVKILKRDENATVRPAFNPSANLFYIVTLADQGQLDSHMIRTFDPATEKEGDLIDRETVNMDVKVIAYHARNKLIIVGGRKLGLPDGIVKTFTTNGELIKEYSLTGQAVALF